MKLKKYSEYKDSGFDWLSSIPFHWDVKKLRIILTPDNQRNRPDLPLLSVVREKGIIKRNIENKDENHNYIPDDLSNYKIVKKDQFVINKMKSWQGSYGISNFNGIVSPAYYVFNRKHVLPDYFHLAIRSKFYVSFFARASDGVRIGQWDLSLTRMKDIPFIIPSQTEQKQIVKFLDYKCAQISKFIREKRRLIELLKEEKQAIINQAVTRGLDPNVKLKPSGIEWLGDIPEHWDVRRLRMIAKVMPSGVDKKVKDSEIPINLCNYVDVYKNEQITDSIDFMKATATFDEINKFELQDNDVLITKDSETWKDIAVPAFVPKEISNLICAYHLAIIRAYNIAGEYLFRAFQAEKVSVQLKISANGVTRYGLSQRAIKDIWIPIPPENEQLLIADYVNKSVKKICSAIEKAQREIDLIQEYRTRLISDVVTGKIDVRDITIGETEEQPDGIETE